MDVKPEPEWKPFLAVIGANVLGHVFTPAAVSSGHRGLSDKAAAQMFQWPHECDDGEKESLQTFTDSFYSTTGDMGTELSIARLCLCDGPWELLPAWMDREPLETNLDLHETVSIASRHDARPRQH